MVSASGDNASELPLTKPPTRYWGSRSALVFRGSKFGPAFKRTELPPMESARLEIPIAVPGDRHQVPSADRSLKSERAATSTTSPSTTFNEITRLLGAGWISGAHCGDRKVATTYWTEIELLDFQLMHRRVLVGDEIIEAMTPWRAGK